MRIRQARFTVIHMSRISFGMECSVIARIFEVWIAEGIGDERFNDISVVVGSKDGSTKIVRMGEG